MSGVNWTNEQRTAIFDRGRTMLVSAAAGSGKTAVIVERIISRIIDENRNINEFLIITYTKAAASELRQKITAELYDRIAENPDNIHLQRQLVLINLANISTIHSFCSDMLREHGGIIGIKPGFRVSDEEEGDILRRAVLDEIIEERYAGGSDGFHALIETLCDAKSDKFLYETVLELHSKSLCHPYPDKWLRFVAESYEGSKIRDISEIMAGNIILGDARTQIRDAILAAEYAIERIKSDEKLSAAYLGTFENDLSMLKNLMTCGVRGWDALAEALKSVGFQRLSPSSRNVEDKALVSLVQGIRNGYKDDIKSLQNRDFTKGSRELLDEIGHCAGPVRELVSIVRELEERFGAEKRARGIMTYSDLEHGAIRLFVKEYSEETDTVHPTELAEDVSRFFTEVMIDEFQDSNGIQDILFRAISSGEKNIIMVGDVKQSIYRFRLADPSIFMRKYKSFPTDPDSPDTPRCVTLSKNFRSRVEVLNAANDMFSRIMSEALGDINYTPREYLYKGLDFPEIPGQNNKSELVLLEVAQETGEDGESPEKLELEAEYIANKILSLIESGFKVTDKDGLVRNVRYSDFAILLRTAKGRSAYYERALGKYGIPCSSEKNEGLLGTVEVTVMTSFLSVIDNPLQDIPLISVLKSPLFGFDADDLCYIRRAGERELYFALIAHSQYTGEDARAKETALKCRDFLKLLTELRDMSDGTPTDKLLWQIYNRTNAIGLFGAMENGEVRQQNLITLFKHAQNFESLGYKGVYRFNAHLARIAERGGDLAAEQNDSQGLDAVRIITIHKSKGLEFPVVFLANCCRQFNMEDVKRRVLMHPKFGVGLTYRDYASMTEHPTIIKRAISEVLTRETKSEEMRILYVAMTRAREKLYLVCTMKDAAKSLKKLFEQTRGPELVINSRLINASGTDAWFFIPLLKSRAGAGLRSFAGIESYEYDMTTDDLDITVTFGNRELREISGEPENAAPARLSPDEPDAAFIGELKRRFAFEYPYKKAVDAPSKITATELFERQNPDVRPHIRAFKKPVFVPEPVLSPAERGIAVHKAMQFIDFGKCADMSGIIAELDRLASQEYLTPEQHSATDPLLIYNFFESDTGRAVLSAKSLRREYQFSVLAPADTLLGEPDLAGEKILFQGVIDLFFETEDGITILDFKTDNIKSAPPPELIRRYGTQINGYAYALNKIEGLNVTRKLLCFLTSNLTVEV